MPKMKTKKTFAKRVKVTGTGKLKTHHNFTSHFAANKTHKQKVNLRKSALPYTYLPYNHIIIKY